MQSEMINDRRSKSSEECGGNSEKSVSKSSILTNRSMPSDLNGNVNKRALNKNFDNILSDNFDEMQCDLLLVHKNAKFSNNLLDYWESDVLFCIRNLFVYDISRDFFKNEIFIEGDRYAADSDRLDCQCNKPCDVPFSPSVVDARNQADDGETFSSGDELDKFESDTDSQDTVIEGEAYKRIRSVAIKEKILHANEELFGGSFKELLTDQEDFSYHESIPLSSTNTVHCDLKSKSISVNDFDYKSGSSSFADNTQGCNLKPLKVMESKHKKRDTNLLCKKNDLPTSFVEDNVHNVQHLFTYQELSSFKKASEEDMCSSESDNGSDVEDNLNDSTSSSSDEATYTTSYSGFEYYSYPFYHKLHTIVEESENEKSSSCGTPTNLSNSDYEYYDSFVIHPKLQKKFRKSLYDQFIATNPIDSKCLDSVINSTLATSRLENYFKSGLLSKENCDSPDDCLTDESGGLSSDDDREMCTIKDKSFDQQNSIFSNTIQETSSLIDHQSSQIPTNISSFVHSPLQELFPNLAIKESNEVFDDETKYVMNHVMEHITQNSKTESDNSNIADSFSMVNFMESEIARLMLTVSPACLSVGDPSSSCSSTIGSNNSDYGSDTLESAEITTSDDEIAEELIHDNKPSFNSHSTPENSALSSDNKTVSFNSLPSADSTITEETLYICKQLMSSLRNITSNTTSAEGTSTSHRIISNSENSSAKQYITDQIISLMQTVNGSQTSSPLLSTMNLNSSPRILFYNDASQDYSDSDSPSPHDEKRCLPKSKTPSESGSETTISASISIPSYDDSDRTPTESEISHEMDELYALLENNGQFQETISSNKICDFDTISLDKSFPSRNIDSPLSEEGMNCRFSESTDKISDFSGTSLLCGAASKLESLLPISIEERIARYKDAFLNKLTDSNDSCHKGNEARINVILPQPISDIRFLSNEESLTFKALDSVKTYALNENFEKIAYSLNTEKSDEYYNITSVKIVSHNTYPSTTITQNIFNSNIDNKYLKLKQESTKEHINSSVCPHVSEKDISKNTILQQPESKIMYPLSKVINAKEKASSENDLLVADYRTKSKENKVFGTKSAGNITELENIHNKSDFRDTGYYSFKSSNESFLSLDDSTASQTSTASLLQYRSLTSTETIPEEEESTTKVATVAKMSLSSSNIPDSICDASSSKSSTLPLSLRNKLSVTPNGNHRIRSSFFSTSGVLRKLTLLRDESGNSLRSSPHDRLRMRNRSLSGGSEDIKHRKGSVPQIAVSECSEGQIGKISSAGSERESLGVHEDEIDQAFAYHSRSQMSLSSFGVRSESVTSVYSAAGGGRYGTVTVTGEILFGLSYVYKAGTFEVLIKECRNLAAVDLKRNRSDPYVKIYLLPDRTKSGKRKTKVKKHTLSPIFDESLKFHITISELEIRTLWLSVWHSDRFGRNDFLGEIMLPLSCDVFENHGMKWYPLQERLESFETPVSYKGDLILALKFVPPDVTCIRSFKKPGSPVKGALEVLVREARNLMATRSNGTSDPFCKSYLLPDKSKSGKQKTPVFKKSCNPKWNHTFIYQDVSIEDLKDRCLELTIWDYDKITSNDFLGGIRLCLGTGKYQGRDVDWMDSLGEERSLWYTMLERPNTWIDGYLLLRPNMQSRRTV